LSERDDQPICPAPEKRKDLTRRDFLGKTAQVGAAAVAAMAVPFAMKPAVRYRSGVSPSRPTQLTIANIATPGNLDPEFGSGADTYPDLLNLNDGLVRWQVVPSNAPTVAGGTAVGGYDVNWGGAKDAFAVSNASLAESYSQSGGGTLWTFKLRRGIMSHAGNELTAHDVKYLYDRAYGLKTINYFLSSIQQVNSSSNVVVVDDYTVQLHTAFPTPLTLLCLNDTIRMCILDSTEMKKHATPGDPWSAQWLKANDAGFGPYTLSNLTPGQQAVWTAFDRPLPRDVYLKGSPQFKQITWRAISDPAQRAALLTTGEVDVALVLSPQQLRALRNAPGIKIWNFPADAMTAVLMNFDYPPLSNTKVRQALSYLVPYDAILKDVFLGYARKAIAPVSDHNQSLPYPILNYKYDPATAKELLREAGYPHGFDTSYIYPTGDALAEQIAVLLKSTFANAGVNVTLNALPPAQYSEELFGKKSPLAYWALGADVPDPAYSTQVFFYSKSSNNFSNYHNATLDHVVETGQRILNYSERLKHYIVAWKAMAADPPWLYLAYPGYQLAAKDNLVGINWDPASASRWDLVTSK
jgi:peptide/nickel transport system substrate-binding protein